MFAVLLLLWCNFLVIQGYYDFPDATVEVFHPKGFKVSVPDETGITLFAFHGNINKQISEREAGTFFRDILKSKDGRWTFDEPNAKLNIGDRINFWIYVQHYDGRSNLGYIKEQEFEVKELIGQTTSTPPSTTTTTTTTTAPSTVAPSPDGDCQPTPTVINNGKTACKGQLIFSDEFNGQMKQDAWTVSNQFAGSPDYEFVVYLNRPETLQVDNQVLKMKPVLLEQLYGSGSVRSTLDLRGNCTGAPSECRADGSGGFILPPVVSSRINTKNKFSFKYGTIEVQAKLPSGDWIYPEIFLNSANNDYGSDYKSGQIRVAFVPGNSAMNKILRGGVILGEGPAHGSNLMKSINSTTEWTKAYHIFRVTWTPESIALAVDGRSYGSIFPSENGFTSSVIGQGFRDVAKWKTDGTKMAPFDKEMYLTLGVGVGGFSFKDDPSKPWKNGARMSMKNFYDAESEWYNTWDSDSALEVDYVKVWAL